MKNSDVINAFYVTQWEKDVSLSQPCKVNTETFEVFEVEYDYETLDQLNYFLGEWVEIDGVRYPLVTQSEYEDRKLKQGPDNTEKVFWVKEN